MGHSLQHWWFARTCRLRQLCSLLRFKPFDTSTPEGISKERYRRIALATLSSAASKGVSLLTMLVSVPLTIKYLGPDRFGLWMTITSLMALVAFTDFGIHNGLLSAIAEANGKGDVKLAQKYVSNGFFMLLGVALVVLAAFACVYRFVPWPRLFNVASELATKESGPALARFVGCTALGMPIGVVQRVQLGYQEGFASNLWQIAGNLLGLGALFLAVQLKAGLPWLVFAVAGTPVLVTLLNWLHYFCVCQPALLPRFLLVDWRVARRLMNTGFILFLLQILALNWYYTDNLIIAQILGSSAVAGYATVQRLMSITMVAQFFILPLWPAYGEAIARSDFSWARKTLVRALVWSAALTVSFSVPVLAFGKSIVDSWTGGEYDPPYSLLFGWVILNALVIVAGNLSSLLVHGETLRKQVPFYTAASIVSLGLKILFAWQFGVAGVVWGAVAGFGLFYTPRALKLAFRSLASGAAGPRTGTPGALMETGNY